MSEEIKFKAKHTDSEVFDIMRNDFYATLNEIEMNQQRLTAEGRKQYFFPVLTAANILSYEDFNKAYLAVLSKTSSYTRSQRDAIERGMFTLQLLARSEKNNELSEASKEPLTALHSKEISESEKASEIDVVEPETISEPERGVDINSKSRSPKGKEVPEVPEVPEDKVENEEALPKKRTRRKLS